MADEMTPELERATSSCRTLFTAFADEFPKAMVDGRKQAWADAVKSVVDFLVVSDYGRPEPSGKEEG